MRHVGRTHRVDLDWIFERLLTDPSIRMSWVNTKQQLADVFTKGSFTEQTWKELCNLIQIAPTSAPISSQACSKQIPSVKEIPTIACIVKCHNISSCRTGTMPGTMLLVSSHLRTAQPAPPASPNSGRQGYIITSDSSFTYKTIRMRERSNAVLSAHILSAPI